MEKDTTDLFKVRNYFDSLSAKSVKKEKFIWYPFRNNFSVFVLFELKESVKPIQSYYYSSGSYYKARLIVKLVTLFINSKGHIVYHRKSNRYYDALLYLKYPKKINRHLNTVFKDFLKEYEKGKK